MDINPAVSIIQNIPQTIRISGMLQPAVQLAVQARANFVTELMFRGPLNSSSSTSNTVSQGQGSTGPGFVVSPMASPAGQAGFSRSNSKSRKRTTKPLTAKR